MALGPASASLAERTRAGGTPALVANVRSSNSSRSEMVQHRDEEPRRRRGLAHRVGCQARQVEEAAETLGVGGDEAEGFDGQFLGSAAPAILPDHLPEPGVGFVFHQHVAVISSAARADEPPGARATTSLQEDERASRNHATPDGE